MPSSSSFLFDTFSRLNVNFVKGAGSWLYTEDDEAYLDFTSGISVNAFGHNHPKLNEALKKQSEKIWHLSNLFPIKGQEQLAKRLCQNSSAEKVFFVNSGAEAIETAIKTARRYYHGLKKSQKYEIITFDGAFHGRTFAALAATGQKKYLEGFEPKMPGFRQVPFGDIEAVKKNITENTAAILIEPIQAEAGVRLAKINFMQNLKKLCEEKDVLFIVDEIQTGIGRSGKFFAYEWSNIQPDIICIAKAIGGGFPLGACLATKKVAQFMNVGSHGSTFGGNPLAMAVGEAVLDLVFEDGLFEHVNNLSQTFKKELSSIIDTHKTILKSYQGHGLLIGIECHILNSNLINECLKQKLLIATAGKNMIRFLPPLNLSIDELREGMKRFKKALSSF